MRGQHHIVALVLVIAVSVVLASAYYLYSQGLFIQTKSSLQQTIEDYTEFSKRYVDILSAVAKIRADINAVQLMVMITNNGSKSIPLYGASVHVYKGDLLVFASPVALASSTCPNPLPPGMTCMFTVDIISPDYSRPDDIYGSYLVMNIHNTRKTAKIEYAGEIPGGATTYYVCNSCSSCSDVLSRAEQDSIVIIDIRRPVDGDCVEVSGAKGVTVYCRSKLVGNGTGVGILIENSSNISIRSCEVENFEYGVYVRNSQNLSFSTAYFHDNTIDIAFDEGSLEDVCTVGSASVVTTSGYIYFATGKKGEVPVLGASALWLIGTDTSAFDGRGGTLSRVSPAIAFCNTSSVSVTSFSVVDTDVGVSLIEDSGTRLEAVDVQSKVYGIYSRFSSDGYICCSSIYSKVGDVFVNPSNMEWGAKTIFAG